VIVIGDYFKATHKKTGTICYGKVRNVGLNYTLNFNGVKADRWYSTSDYTIEKTSSIPENNYWQGRPMVTINYKFIKGRARGPCVLLYEDEKNYVVVDEKGHMYHYDPNLYIKKSWPVETVELFGKNYDADDVRDLIAELEEEE